jgi:hypothetical protein
MEWYGDSEQTPDASGRGKGEMLWGYPISSILKYEAFHFGFSAFVGWLAYSLTSTILWRTGLKDFIPRRCMSLLPLLVSLSFAVLAHVVEDYTLNWF